MTNLFIPQHKLATKTRIGAKVTKTYDTATAPYQRILRDHPDLLDNHDRQTLALRLAQADPVATRGQISLSRPTSSTGSNRSQRVTKFTDRLHSRRNSLPC